MAKMITVQVPDTKDNKAIIAGLLGIPGVKIEIGGAAAPTDGGKYATMTAGAAIANVNYFTFRRWVVEEKKIPYERPSGAKKGGVRLLVTDIEAFMEGRDRKKTTRGGRVKVLG